MNDKTGFLSKKVEELIHKHASTIDDFYKKMDGLPMNEASAILVTNEASAILVTIVFGLISDREKTERTKFIAKFGHILRQINDYYELGSKDSPSSP